MTFNGATEAFVWIWLPGQTTPVVVGRLSLDNGMVQFNYGKSYLQQPSAIPIYAAELPLRPGVVPAPVGLKIHGCIRDAAPDAWGRRVIINKRFGHRGNAIDITQLGELDYLLESGSDRIGALDFQKSPTEYIPRITGNASMQELLESAERVQQGIPLTSRLDRALLHGSSVGGARPKALIDYKHKKYIAKFASSSDLHSMVKAEFIAMRLAKLAGLDVAGVKLATAGNKEVLLVERFDRLAKDGNYSRRCMLSAHTLLAAHNSRTLYPSYETLAEIIRHSFAKPKDTLRELFSRLAFNIMCGNTDDHARNHAAFYDGRDLSLTPAYDLCPQVRTASEPSQAMLIHGNNRISQIATCISAASNFLLAGDDAREICMRIKTTIENQWDAVCKQAKLSDADKNHLWGRQFLNPHSTTGLDS